MRFVRILFPSYPKKDDFDQYEVSVGEALWPNQLSTALPIPHISPRKLVFRQRSRVKTAHPRGPQGFRSIKVSFELVK